MILERFSQLRDWTIGCFPERHIYLRSGGEMKTIVLSTPRQLWLAGLVCAIMAWTLISTLAMAVNAFAAGAGEQAAVRTKAYYERLIADRQARLDSAVAQLSEGEGSVQSLAETVEHRHAALAMLLTDLRGAPGAAAVLAPALPSAKAAASAESQIDAVRRDQERLVAAAETYARTRADRLKLALRLAGLNPAAYAGSRALGGPLIEAKDPRALAAVLDVDEDFAERIQAAAGDLYTMKSLKSVAEALPLNKPVVHPVRSSGYGVRFDPFTRRPAFHAGQDFSGGFNTPILATAPGIVSFTGARSGYGNTVEIDHGRGFKTRYAHLQGIAVRRGQKVGVGQRIGGMGSTGRSTGVHLHYEVWQNGRVQDPTRFLRAGDHVQQDHT
jgi:murein DD-endopeptidase MepM/ murein hydrolase activator NlpD